MGGALVRGLNRLGDGQVLVKPVQHPGMDIELVFLFARAVRFSWIDYQFSFDVVAFESTIKSTGLPDRIDGIVLPLQD